MSDMTFERRVSFHPAFDKRHPDPSKNYGIGAATIQFVLIGPGGATQFVMSTGWYLPHVRAGLLDKADLFLKPDGWDVGYHSPVPQYDGQEPMGSGPCEYLNGRPCYYDGSGLAAEPVLDALLREGDAAVWRVLEQRYCELFMGEQAGAA